MNLNFIITKFTTTTTASPHLFQGFCMRGEMCPFDHGVDPVVVEDSALSTVLTYTSNGGAPMPDIPSTIIPPPIMGATPMMHPMQPRGLPAEYNPQAPQMWHGGGGGGGRSGFRGPRPPMLGPGAATHSFIQQPPNMQRQLISVPVMDNKQNEQYPQNYGMRYEQDQEGGGGGGFMKKKQFDFGRLGPRVKNPANCSLELKKVPSGLNNITHLNNHFSKFGKIVNIQVCYEGDPEAAIVTFSSHAEANAAYRSTEAVLNNRFIKVFWHSGNADGKFYTFNVSSIHISINLKVNKRMYRHVQSKTGLEYQTSYHQTPIKF